MFDVALIILLIALNAFFVAAEFALVKVRALRLEQLASEGAFTAKLNRKMRLNLESYLAACQLGITMASIALGWVGEPAFTKLIEPFFRLFNLDAQLIHTVAFLIGFIIISSLHLVVGEQIPKTIAIRKPERVALWLAIPLEFFYLLSRPLNRLLSKTSNGILHRFGIEEVSYVEYMTGEELREMIDFSEEHGGIETKKAEMISNLFAFDERTVSQIMVPRNEVVYLDVQAPMAESVKKMREYAHSRMPLIDGDPDTIIGIILIKDLFNAALGGQTEPWQDMRPFAREALIVPETMSVSKLFETMRRKQAHMALIVDEYGAMAGLVTLEDLLEEIVGEIADELDDAEPEFSIQQTDMGWEAHGLMSLTDLSRTIDFEVPEALDANTISGLIMHELQDIPKVGDVVEYAGYQISVLEVKDRYVEKVRLVLIQPDEAGDDDASVSAHHESNPSPTSPSPSPSSPKTPAKDDELIVPS